MALVHSEAFNEKNEAVSGQPNRAAAAAAAQVIATTQVAGSGRNARDLSSLVVAVVAGVCIGAPLCVSLARSLWPLNASQVCTHSPNGISLAIGDSIRLSRWRWLRTCKPKTLCVRAAYSHRRTLRLLVRRHNGKTNGTRRTSEKKLCVRFVVPANFTVRPSKSSLHCPAFGCRRFPPRSHQISI